MHVQGLMQINQIRVILWCLYLFVLGICHYS